MPSVTSFRVLGAHTPAAGAPYDGADLLLTTDGGPRVLGFRTAGYVERHDPFVGDGATYRWAGGYRPLAITLDRRTVAFWDFSEVMWIGPAAHPCVFWSNASGMTELGLQRLLAPVGRGAVLAGPDGRGLPTPEMLGLALPADLPEPVTV